MSTVPSPEGGYCIPRAVWFAAVCLALTACSTPQFPDPAPTKEEVPFLGQQMTQEQIGQWQDKISAERAQLEQTFYRQKVDCYQRFFVNTCLRKQELAYRKKESALRKQEIELRRQERVLTEIDKQLRLKERQQRVQ